MGSLIFLSLNRTRTPEPAMPFDKISDELPTGPLHRVSLDERFIALFIPETTQDRIEAQELRQILLTSLQKLPPDEFRIIELRYQHKKSRGQVASLLDLKREEALALEEQALERLRTPLQAYMEA
jgi:RNA polymerase sigma factor (sigma-70 family)